MKKSIITVFLTLLLIIQSFAGENNGDKKYVLVIHGGAGAVSRDIPESLKQEYIDGLNQALLIGKSILTNGGSALDAVEKVVNYLEDHPSFNAGKGSVLTSDGTVEMDAAIMSGIDLSAGAVAGIKNVKNPISLARLVAEKTPHVLLIGEGAEKFADEMKVQKVDSTYFFIRAQNERWKELKKKISEDKKGTVGAVALDINGNLAAATSTGGMMMKRPGRVGDVPIIGAGTYANNKTCAVSATGWGEKFIKNNVAVSISKLMEYKGLSISEAVDELINKVLVPNDGGVIALDKFGNYSIMYNTKSMFRGVITSEGKIEIKIWE
ncbi:MAG: isoaspartyl peptidase/L-asparaginase [Ignavibacteria bacterium]|nr:isoaspartyl peptidase/L-asparaginase [Ignavibacteria bacterium]